MFTASEIFDLAIQVEENGESFYRHASQRVVREPLKELLRWLAEQEVEHRGIFQDLKKKLCSEEDSCGPLSGATGASLRAAMGRHAFSLDELEVKSIEGEKELLQAALEFEEDAIEFFEFITFLISGQQALSAIQDITRQEINHKRLLIEKISQL